MSTQFDIYSTIKSAMADNAEVVEFCEKQMAAIERKREAARGRKRVYKPSQATIAMREAVATFLGEQEEDVVVTNKEIVAGLAASFEANGSNLKATPQGVAAAIRALIAQDTVERIPAVTKSGADSFRIISE